MKFLYILFCLVIFVNRISFSYAFHDPSDGRHYQIEVIIGDEPISNQKHGTRPQAAAAPTIEDTQNNTNFLLSNVSQEENVSKLFDNTDQLLSTTSELSTDDELSTTHRPVDANGEPIYPLESCYTNQYGFMCCNQELEIIIEETYSELALSPTWHACNIQKIALAIQVNYYKMKQ
uniref:Uncharacterized protein n=1 Tax=Acrobeloides nanus TaxID=290746 RepID=A0A914D464_9BILA